MTEVTRNNSFSDIVSNRRSIRKYDQNVKISRVELLKMLDEASTAPSAFNIEPWHFTVADEQNLIDQVATTGMGNNADQIKSAAALVVVNGTLSLKAQAKRMLDGARMSGIFDQATYDEQTKLVNMVIDGMQDETAKNNYILQNTSLFAMQFMLVARAHGYDTCMMTGFDHAKLADILSIDPFQYKPVALFIIGKADETGFPSYRIPARDITDFK